MKTFAIGDIHGGYKALKQCLNAARFNYAEDELIVLGDVCDGWSQTRECMDELLQIANLIFVMGNHDWWAYQWITKGAKPFEWTSQGGEATLKSYKDGVPDSHIALLRNSHYKYIDDKNRLFVHGGFDWRKSILDNNSETLMWNRQLIRDAYDFSRMGGSKPKKMTQFAEVFLGHTPVSNLGGLDTPLKFFEIWALDTGGGWEGKVTIMDIDTHEYWQSDVVADLYPGDHGRQGHKLRRAITDDETMSC